MINRFCITINIYTTVNYKIYYSIIENKNNIYRYCIDKVYCAPLFMCVNCETIPYYYYHFYYRYYYYTIFETENL